MSSLTITDFEAAPFEIIDGDRGKNYPKQNEYSDSGYCLFLSATNVTRSGFEFSECQFITEQKDEVLRKGKLQRDDVVLTTRGTIGNAAYFKASIPYEHMRINSGMVILRSNDEKILPAYLYHFLRSPAFHGQVNSLRSGVAQPQLPIRDMKRIKMPLPPLREQTRIVSILSAYDDLIENNRRRIQLLEQAARLVYKEWFVHLRFPGHEHVTITGGVPEGWERKPFSELAIFLNGFAFKPAHLGEVGLPIVKIPELRDGPTAKTPRNTGEHIPEKYLLGNGDILFSWSGTLLVNIWNHGKGLLNQHLFKVTPTSANLRGLVYFALRQALVEFQNQTTGSTMKHIRKGALEKVAPLIPPPVLLNEFESAVDPMLQQISVLQRVTTEATKASDLLLPRLMNGEKAM